MLEATPRLPPPPLVPRRGDATAAEHALTAEQSTAAIAIALAHPKKYPATPSQL